VQSSHRPRLVPLSLPSWNPVQGQGKTRGDRRAALASPAAAALAKARRAAGSSGPGALAAGARAATDGGRTSTLARRGACRI